MVVGASLVVLATGGLDHSLIHRVRVDEQILTATAEQILHDRAGDDGCFEPSTRDTRIEPLGPVSQICTNAAGPDGHVVIVTGRRRSGLIYYSGLAGMPPVFDICLRHDAPRWWEFSATNDNVCPDGMEFSGSG